MIVNQRRADSVDFVGTDRRADSASTDRHSAIHLASHDGFGQRNYEIRIIITRSQLMRSKIYDLVTRRPQSSDEFFLQSKPAMIRGDTDPASSG